MANDHAELLKKRRYSVRIDMLNSKWWKSVKTQNLNAYKKLKALSASVGKEFITLHLGRGFEPLAYDQGLNKAMPERIFIFGSEARQRFFESPICNKGAKWVGISLPPD